MFDHLNDIAELLEYVEEVLEAVSNDGRYLLYVRDLGRLVSWLKTQPRSRAIMVGGVTAAVLVAMLVGSRRPADGGSSSRP